MLVIHLTDTLEAGVLPGTDNAFYMRFKDWYHVHDVDLFMMRVNRMRTIESLIYKLIESIEKLDEFNSESIPLFMDAVHAILKTIVENPYDIADIPIWNIPKY